MHFIKVKGIDDDCLHYINIESIDEVYYDKTYNHTYIGLHEYSINVEGDVASKIIRIATNATTGGVLYLE